MTHAITTTNSWWQSEADKAGILLDLLAAQAKGKLLVFFDNLESIQNPTTRELDEKQGGAIQKAVKRLLGKNAFATWIKAAQQREDKGVSLLLTSRWKIPHWQEDTHLALEQCSYNDYLALARQKSELQSLLQDRNKLRKVHNTLHGNARALEFFAVAIQGIDSKKEADFLQKLAQANAESQADMALAFIIKHRSPAERELLNRLQVYTCPVAIEGVVKLSLVDNKLENPRQLLNNLLNVSLLEKSYAEDMQCAEYQCSSQVRQWLSEQSNPPPTRPFFIAAAEYHAHLFQYERKTLQQAITLHTALKLAKQTIEADKLALDWIVGNLSRQGFYQTILEDWLPDICKSEDPKTRGEALGQTGKQLHHIGDYETALNYLKQSLNITQEVGDKSGEGATLNNISQIFQARGDYETALKYLKQSLNIQQEIGDKEGEGTTLNNISQIFKARGDYETALKYLKQSLNIQQEIGDKDGEGRTLNNISAIYNARGDYETALKYLKQSLNIRQEIGDSAGLCATLFNMGHIYWQNDNPQEAMATWISVYKIAKPMGEAQALEALESLAGHIGLEGGLQAWEMLAAKVEDG